MSSATRSSRWLPATAVAALLLVFFLQAFLASRQLSPGHDEVAGLPAGYVFLKTGQWRVVPGHPPLVFALSALPLLALHSRLDLNDPWLTATPTNQWNVGLNFLRLNNDDDRIFMWGRIPVLLLSLLLGYFVFRWARELYGTAAALVALTLYVFCPTLVAHSGIVSYDVGLSAFSTLALYFLWRFVRVGTWRNLIWTGVLLGLALASKTPAVLLPPVFAVLMLAVAWRPTTTEAISGARGLAFPMGVAMFRERVLGSAVTLLLMLLIAGGVVYLVFVFPTDPLFYVTRVLEAPRLHANATTYPYYLMGQFRPGGWWYYFLVAFVVKTPVPTLLLIGLAGWLWWRSGRSKRDELFLLVPAAGTFVLMSAMAFQIGVRYVMPALPLLFIFASRATPIFTRSRRGLAIGALLLVWYLSIPLRIYPDYLAYFNELAGGSSRGSAWLDDSNIEWGQQLKRIKRYLDAHRFDRVKLIYFTLGRPEYYGIRAESLPFDSMARPPQPGIYIVGIYELVRAKKYYGADWLARYKVLDRIGYSVFVLQVT